MISQSYGPLPSSFGSGSLNSTPFVMRATVSAPAAPTTASTYYSYDILGNLTQTVDANGNITAMTYNWLGQKTSMQDPDMGTWYYGYDKNGNLTGQLWEIKTTKQPGNTPVLHDVKHTWDPGSNLFQKQDLVSTDTENFSYDFPKRGYYLRCPSFIETVFLLVLSTRNLYNYSRISYVTNKETPIEDTAAKKVEKGSFFTKQLPMFVAAHFSHHLMTALPAPLLPFIRSDFNLDYTKAAWVISAFSLAYGFSQLPSGWLADRISRSTMITIGIVGVAAAGLLMGFASTYTLLIVFLVLMGILGGGYHPAATPWVSASAGEKSQGRALGIHFVGGGAGFFVAPIVAAAIASAWGWQRAFVILAGPSLVFGIIFYLFLRRQTRTSQLKTMSAHNADTTSPAKDRWRPLIALLFMSLIAGGMGSVIAFLSLYLVDSFNVSKQLAATLMAASSFAGLWAGPVGGHLSDRIGRLPIILGTSVIGGLLLLSIRFIHPGISLLVLLVSMGSLLFFMGINGYLSAPVSEAFIIRQTSTRNRSTIYGLYYLAGQGGALFAPLMGSLIDHLGFPTTATIAGISTVFITIICGAILLSAGEKAPQAPEPTT